MSKSEKRRFPSLIVGIGQNIRRNSFPILAWYFLYTTEATVIIFIRYGESAKYSYFRWLSTMAVFHLHFLEDMKFGYQDRGRVNLCQPDCCAYKK